MARKNATQSDAPDKKPGRLAQIRQVYTAARQVDPMIGWWMLISAVVVLAVAAGVGLVFGRWVYGLILGIPLALLAATLVLSRRAERAAYRAIEGQPGAAGAALGALRRGWYFDQQPVAVEGARGMRPDNMAGAAFVFRAVGRPGIVLIGEGPGGRLPRLLEAERKKLTRVAPGVPVHLVQAGDGADQVPLRKLSNKLTKMKPVLTKAEVSVVNKRLTSLGGMRPPVPAGMDPLKARVDRRAMRGR